MACTDLPVEMWCEILNYVDGYILRFVHPFFGSISEIIDSAPLDNEATKLLAFYEVIDRKPLERRQALFYIYNTKHMHDNVEQWAIDWLGINTSRSDCLAAKISSFYGNPVRDTNTTYAAMGGQLHLLNNCTEKDIAAAISQDRLDVLQWYSARKLRLNKYAPKVFSVAAVKANNMAIIIWLHKMKWLSVAGIRIAVLYQRYEILQYYADSYYSFDDSVMVVAARVGLEMMKFLRALGCMYTYHSICSTVVSNDTVPTSEKIEMLKLIHRQELTCPETARAAAESGNMEILEWLAANHYPIPHKATIGTIRCGRMDAFQWLIDRGLHLNGDFVLAAKYGRLAMLKILMEFTCKSIENYQDVLDTARTNKQNHIVRWVEKHCYVERNVIKYIRGELQ